MSTRRSHPGQIARTAGRHGSPQKPKHRRQDTAATASLSPGSSSNEMEDEDEVDCDAVAVISSPHHCDAKAQPAMFAHASIANEPRPSCRSRLSKTTNTLTSALMDNETFLELASRARRMLCMESTRAIDDYFQQRRSSSNERDAASASPPLDAGCRVKMVDWSCRIAECCWPQPRCPAVASPSSSPCTRRRYSVQALQVVLHSFDLVDRLSTLHWRQHKRACARAQYKLICVVCLHLAAKTSGALYSHGDEQEQALKGEEAACAPSAAEDDGASQRWLSSLTRGDDDGQTAVPTPNQSNDNSGDNSSSPVYQTQQQCFSAHPPRPIDVLSLTGLSYLGDYSLECLVCAEWTALQNLEWRLTSATSIDWCQTLLDVWSLAYSSVTRENATSEVQGGNGEGYLEIIWDGALANLERALVTHKGMTLPPSLMAWTAVVRALDDCSRNFDGNDAAQWADVSIVYKEVARGMVLPDFGEEETVMTSCFS